MAEQLQNLLHTRQELAAIEERNRLARDLHDSVKQQVFATVMQVGAAREMIPEDAETAIQRLDEAERLSRQAQAELTTIIQELRPATLPERNFSSALKEYITDWSQLNKIDSEFRMGDECSLPAEVEQAIFRVTQEALSNVARHSQATRIEVDLVRENDVISISIADNGVGFVLTDRAGKGIGLISMRERVEAIGGEFSVKSTSEQGTQIIARCPIERSVS